jgi:anti-anti-sigma factor
MPLSSMLSAPVAPPAPFTCTRTGGGVGAGWITPTGELDLATAPQLDEALRTAQSEARLVVLDLRHLEFIASAGVHVVVDATERAREGGRRLVTVRAPALIDMVFGLTGSASQVDMVDLPPHSVLHRALA